MKCYKLLVCFSVITLFANFPVSFSNADPKKTNRIQKSGASWRRQANMLRVAARMAPPQQNRQDANSQRPQNSVMTGQQSAPIQESATVEMPTQHTPLEVLKRPKGAKERRVPSRWQQNTDTDESAAEAEVTNTPLALPDAEDNTDTIDSSNQSAKAVSGEAINAPQKQGVNQAPQEEDKERSVANTQQEQKSLDTTEEAVVLKSQPDVNSSDDQGQFPIQEASRAVVKEIGGLSDLVTQASSFIHETSNNMAALFGNRMINVMASGEEERSVSPGMWISGLYSTNRQGVQNSIPGYSGNTYGATIGFDVALDNDFLGVAYGNALSRFKYNDKKNTASIRNNIFSLYGQKDFGRGFFLQAVTSLSYAHVKNKSKRLNDDILGTHKNVNYSAQILLNRKYTTSSGIAIVPNIGARYTHSRYGTYTDNDINLQHLSLNNKTQNLITGIIGSKIMFKPLKISDSCTVTPSVHASIEHIFNNKNKHRDIKITYKNENFNETIAVPKLPKIAYNVGAGIMADRKNVQLSTEYGYHLSAKKYHSHQLFVKLKVNF